MIINYIYDGYYMDYLKYDKTVNKVHFNKVLEIDTKNKTLFDNIVTDNSIKKNHYDFIRISIKDFSELCTNLRELGYSWDIPF